MFRRILPFKRDVSEGAYQVPAPVPRVPRGAPPSTAHASDALGAMQCEWCCCLCGRSRSHKKTTSINEFREVDLADQADFEAKIRPLHEVGLHILHPCGRLRCRDKRECTRHLALLGNEVSSSPLLPPTAGAARQDPIVKCGRLERENKLLKEKLNRRDERARLFAHTQETFKAKMEAKYENHIPVPYLCTCVCMHALCGCMEVTGRVDGTGAGAGAEQWARSSI